MNNVDERVRWRCNPGDERQQPGRPAARGERKNSDCEFKSEQAA